MQEELRTETLKDMNRRLMYLERTEKAREKRDKRLELFMSRLNRQIIGKLKGMEEEDDWKQGA